jgi:hypothetical protein
LTEFDQKNHWIIDRGDGKPSVNLVPGPVYRVETSADLQTWTDAGAAADAGGGDFQFDVNLARSAAQQFFRVRAP